MTCKYNVITTILELVRANIHVKDTARGLTQTDKLCAAPEESGYEYNVGCDTIDIPFKQEECYCKLNLCNGVGKLSLTTSILTTATTICLAIIWTSRF